MIVHYTEKYLLNPVHRITVNLVGLGGTGSQMLTCLARLNETLKALGHPGLHLKAWDPDTVTSANLGRQLFSPADLNQSKAIVLTSRINRFMGLDWEAHPREYNGGEPANILITCIDTAAGRVALSEHVVERKTVEVIKRPYYWLDLGNLQKTGQAILGTVNNISQPKSDEHTTRATLPNVVKFFPRLRKIKEEQQGPSCSLAEAIRKQDLFINSALAQFGATLLWKLFREGMIRHHGFYLNLDTLQTNPIPIK
ncbi:MAG TPA: PRTRC system ThiF family protein [Puia sp.]|jgi:PRTRC genetic system ThiF family protein